jgi:hypothetical protein
MRASKWHSLSEQGAFSNDEARHAFRRELRDVKQQLVAYTRALADIAGVEALTELGRKS